MINSIDNNTNLHQTALEVARLNKLSSLHDGINFVIDDLTAKFWANCVLTYDDVTVLLLSTSNFKNYLKWIAEFDDRFKYKFDDSGFGDSCKKYLVCTKPNFTTTSRMTDDDINSCKSEIWALFETAFNYYNSRNKIGDYSFGDEVFLNGSLEDGPFDIYYDIEQIHKVLYANPTRIPNYYLRRPLSYEDDKINNALDTKLVDNKLPLWLIPVNIYAQSDPIQDMSIQDAINQIKWTEQSTQIVSNLQCLTWVTTANQIPISDEVKGEIEKIRWDILTFQEEVVVDNFIDDVLPSIDPTVWVKYKESLVFDSENIWSLSDNNWNIGNWDEPTLSANPHTNTCPTNTIDIQKEFGINTNNPKVVACIKNCQDNCGGTKTTLTDDRKSCYQSCLCWVKQWDRWPLSWTLWGIDFWVKFCLVPSTTTDVITPGRQILSIQELVDSINNITSKLKESWQVIPSSKKKEFFSPTVKVKNLVDLFNFTVNTVTRQEYKKPISDKAKETVQKNIFNSEDLDITEQQIRWIYDKQNFISDFINIQDTFWTQVSEVINDRYAQIANIK